MQVEFEREIILPGALKPVSFRVDASQRNTKLILLEIDSHNYSITLSRSRSTYERSSLLGELKKHHEGEWLPPTIELLGKLPLETVSAQLGRSEGGLVAVNGGFFIDYGAIFESNNEFDSINNAAFYGDPVGWLRINGEDLSLPFLERPALKINRNGMPKIEENSLMGKELLFKRINQKVILNVKNACSNSKNAYFTNDTALKENTTNDYAQFISIVNNKVLALNNSGDEVDYPSNGFVVGLLQRNKAIQIGDIVELTNDDEYINVISGGPLLLINGKPTTDSVWESEDFLNNNHPKTLTKSLYSYTCARTGAFTLSSGNLLLSVCSGRTDTLEVCGLTLAEFTEATVVASGLLGLNIKDGMYLDGGACTTFCYKQGEQISHIVFPSGTSNPQKKGRLPGHEAEIGSAIIISKKVE